MAEEIVALVRRCVPEGVGDVRVALEVLGHLIEQARVVAVQAYRHAAQDGTA